MTASSSNSSTRKLARRPLATAVAALVAGSVFSGVAYSQEEQPRECPEGSAQEQTFPLKKSEEQKYFVDYSFCQGQKEREICRLGSRSPRRPDNRDRVGGK